MLRKGIGFSEFTSQSMEVVARGISEMNKNWGLEVATCCEEIDLSKYNIKKNKCIDGDLMIKLFPNDKELMEFLGWGLKDKGQRKNCGCIMSKDIGRYDSCGHRCVYCYANSSPEAASNNYQKYLTTDRKGESILPLIPDK